MFSYSQLDTVIATNNARAIGEAIETVYAEKTALEARKDNFKPADYNDEMTIYQEWLSELQTALEHAPAPEYAEGDNITIAHTEKSSNQAHVLYLDGKVTKVTAKAIQVTDAKNWRHWYPKSQLKHKSTEVSVGEGLLIFADCKAWLYRNMDNRQYEAIQRAARVSFISSSSMLG